MMMGAVMTDDEDDDDEEEGVKELIGMNKGWPNFCGTDNIYFLELNPGIESYNSTQTHCGHHIGRCFVNLFQKFLLHEVPWLLSGMTGQL